MGQLTDPPNAAVRVSHRGPVLPFKVPVVPWWVAVPAMALVVLAAVVVAVVAVLS